MSEGDQLLLFRLALLAIIFGFVVIAALLLRAGLGTRAPAPAPPTSRAPRRPTLVLLSPARTGIPAGAVFHIAGEMTIGRDMENGIVLADASVSGRHAIVTQARDRWLVEDLGSTNGTLVNGRALDGRRGALRHGDKLTVGAVVLRFDA